ncbi:unnamed protein product [Rotaria sordida]|uniref:Saposin B-type domain-containing protein n=2 Tax=Rotaria sordida TaxID=392033 RepID=A0A815C7N9_9BILA|nr:unnamed protein product [Rotaria sordida]CAF1283440.1 unnamed protein product [Rotaria sordida]
MYMTLTFIVLVGISVLSSSPLLNTRSHNIYRIAPILQRTKVGLDLCPTCINEAVEVLNILLNAVLDEGILATCNSLCGIVANKTGSKLLGEICALACDAFGLDEFIKEIIKLDLDPIWYCEMAKMCPINDHGDAKFTNFHVSPTTGPRKTKFILDCSFVTKNGTGTGMLTLTLIYPNKQSAATDFLLEAQKPGSYIERIPIDVIEPNCDPSRGLCDDWPVGTYNVTAEICNGECGSHHPHSATYDMGKASFTVTK